jgi:hypothetical protein
VARTQIITRAHDGLFDHCSNLFGGLDGDIRRRLELVIADPEKHWNDNHGIILRGKVGSGRWLTLWQSVIAVDPTFPKTGPLTDGDGNVINGWAQFPDRVTILKAILFAAEGAR